MLEKPFAEKICRKILHKSELEQYSQLQDIDLKTKFFATRWAVKESAIKAADRKDLSALHMILEKTSTGKPVLKFIDKGYDIIYSQLRAKEHHISISHEVEYAVAFVILCQ